MSAVLKEIPTSSPVTQFLATAKRMLINGKWVPAASGKTFEVTNPATGNVIANAAEGDKADIDAAVQAARRALESGPWATMTPSARGKMIWRIGDLISKYADELAGGYKQSGWGREMGEAVLDSYLNTKAVTVRL